ncbi:PstS family phosphate ABC transporter substrate-binding protein [Nesterenkonia massiliensis]|uniref:PstS family phosphate ABC transporter substrate-binding protein n=1 Tax=Nesterenkonia massiliensis TaxID=1232429 RepID=A0ABT2HP64_9MICC|nr:PstS family phosphate ABC transporter substrate-binding protein [Nesterenkonia massiliensis]MCT1606480.1 PstS family phosphate ABC transporter substrate-binding protein [Nesterenkonia massiliensis]
MSRTIRGRSVAALFIAAGLGISACAAGEAHAGQTVLISGSSTVAPITELVAREGGFDVEISAEGTTDGFQRFCTGQTDVNNASEAIPGEGQPLDLLSLCQEKEVEFIELPIGIDTLTVVRHLDNEFAASMTMDEVQEVWAPDSEVTTWSQIRPEWPDEEIELAGRPPGSGTFDYFTHHVVGQTGEIRDDYFATDDLDELMDWVAEHENALAFMGIGNYYSAGDDESREEVSTVSVDGVVPTLENAQNGSYPLTRPLFIYVSVQALEEKSSVGEFVEHYLENAHETLPRTFFYRLPGDAYESVQQRYEDTVTGSLYEGDPFRAESVTELLQ